MKNIKSQNLVKNNFVRSTQNSPASWCKKSDSRLQKCNRRFFARSGESEALPLKAKKRSFLARRGSGVGGAALFAKETSENNGNKITESIKDSQGGLPRRFCESARNDEFIRDSSYPPLPHNDNVKKFAESAWRFAFSFRWIRVCEVDGILLFAKAKSSKNFKLRIFNFILKGHKQ